MIKIIFHKYSIYIFLFLFSFFFNFYYGYRGVLPLDSFLIFDSGLPQEIPGAFIVSVAPCGVTSIVLCSAYNVSPENIIKAIFISTFASIATIFFAIQYLTI